MTHKQGKRWGESGNVFFTLFGAVALVGVVGAATSTLMRGPVGTVIALNQKAKVDAQLQIARKLAGLASAGLSCDMDNSIEPVAPAACATAPTGGGCLPNSVGAAKQDAWGTDIGYCGWDHGWDVGPCAGLLSGEDAIDKPVIAIISAGPNRVFDTTCSNTPNYYTDGVDPLTSGGDDIVFAWTYDEASDGVGGGLWRIKSGTTGTITPDESITELEVGLPTTFTGSTTAFDDSSLMFSSARLDLRNDAYLQLPNENELAVCNSANDGMLRIFTDGTPGAVRTVQICDSDPGNEGPDANGWVDVGGSGSSSSVSGSDGWVQFNFDDKLASSAYLTFSSANGLRIDSEHATTDLIVVKGATVGGAMAITGATTIASTLGVTGQTTLGLLSAGNTDVGTLDAGSTDITGTLDVSSTSNLSTLNAGNTSITGTLGVSSTTTLGASLSVSGDISDPNSDVVIADGLTVNNMAGADAFVLDGTAAAQVGMFGDAGGLELMVGGSNALAIDSSRDSVFSGKVSIMKSTPAVDIDLDVFGLARIGYNLSACGPGYYGAIRYNSGGDTLDICSSTDSWVTVGTSGGGGSGASGGWRIDNSGDFIYYENASYIIDQDVSDISFASTVLEGAGTRFLWYPSRAGVRFGEVTGDQWDDFKFASHSFGFGYNAEASGIGSFAAGTSVTASDDNAFAFGSSAISSSSASFALGTGVHAAGVNSFALGETVRVNGINSMGIGLGESTGVDPIVSGSRSLGIFMGDRNGMNFNTDNTMGIFGGDVLIDPTGATVAASNTLLLDVEGQIGGDEYCNEDGAFCFTAEDVSSGALGAPGNESEVIFHSGGVLYTSPEFIFSSANRLGLGGTLSPVAQIELSEQILLGNVDDCTAATQGALRMNATSDTLEMCDFAGAGGYIAIGGGSVAAPGTDRDIIFNSNGLLAADPNFFFTSAGVLSVDNTNTQMAVDIVGGIRIDSDGATIPDISMNQNGVLSADDSLTMWIDPDDDVADGRFAFQNGSGQNRLMTIRESGKVGIGDNTPDLTLLLDVEGQIGGTEYCDEDGLFCFDAQDVSGVSPADDREIFFNSNGRIWTDDNFVFSSNGEFGVGLTNPDDELDIVGTAQITGATVLGDTLNVTGISTFLEDVQLKDGSETDPALTFTNDTDTGLFVSGGDRLGFATNGTAAMFVDPNGALVIGDQTRSGTLLLDVEGDTGSQQYCDEFGNFCFTAEQVATGSVGVPGGDREVLFNSNGTLATDVGFVFDSGGDLVIGTTAKDSYLTDGDADLFVESTVRAADIGIVADASFFWNDGSTSITGSGVTDYIDFETDSTVQMRLTSAGRLGIGTSAPAGKLQVGNDDATGQFITGIDGYNLYVTAEKVIPAFDDDFANVYSELIIDSAADTNEFYAGYYTAMATKVGNIHNFNTIIGSWNIPRHEGTGTVSELSGVIADTQNNGAGTITSSYGFKVSNLLNNGTIDNTYGVYIGDVSTGTQTNIPYSLYASDPDARNYFAGDLSIATLNSDTRLDVNGTIKMAYGGEACDASREGAIHFDSAADAFFVCQVNGDGWERLTTEQSFGNTGDDREIFFNSNGALATNDGFVFTSTGLFGVNTATPGSRAHIYSASGAATMTVEGDEAGISSLALLTTGNAASSVGTGTATGWEVYAIGDTNATTAAQNDLSITYWNGATYVTPLSIDHTSGNVSLGGFDRDADSILELSMGGTPRDAFMISSNNDNDGDYLIVDSAGLMGLATQTPYTRLDVNGTAKIAYGGETCDANREGAIHFDSVADRFFVCQDAAEGWIQLATDNATAADPDRSIQFKSGDNFAGSAGLRYDSSGDVIIGTSAKPSWLTDASNDLWIEGTIRVEDWITISSGDSYGWGDSSAYITGDTSDDYIAFTIENTERLRLTSAGRLGLGTTDPYARLDVNGTIKMAYGGEACDANREGAIHFDSSQDAFYVCQNSGAWQRIVTEGGSGGTPAGGANREIQFNSNGSLAGDTSFVFSSTGDFLLTAENDGSWTGVASVPVSGAGSRMFFDSQMAAFRAGYVDGVQWDNANIGEWSVAMGNNAVASGDISIALGYNVTASNQTSFAAGWGSNAAGISAVALGNAASAIGNWSAAMGGYVNTANGDYSMALGGSGAVADGDYSMALGNTVFASGNYSMVMGNNSSASGVGGMAFGNQVVSGNGVIGSGEGDYSMAIGLIDDGVTITDKPQVTGTQSLGIFMDDQDGLVVPADRQMGLFGGKLMIDPNVPATQLATSNALTVDVEGDVGAIQYCDEDGNFCFTAADVSGGSIGAPGGDREMIFNSNGFLATDASFVFDSAGRMGIGVSTPHERLDIVNAHLFHAGGSIVTYQNAFWDSIDGRVEFAGYGTNKFAARQTLDQNAGRYFIDMSTNAGDANDPVTWGTALTLTSTGRFGIGTSNPAAALHLYQGGANVEFMVQGGDANQSNISMLTKGDGATVIGDASTSGWLLSARGVNNGANAEKLIFSYNDLGSWKNNVTFTSGGSIGIGTMIPDTRLDVNGTIKMAYGGETCDASREGAIHFDSSDDSFYVCGDGATWQRIIVAGGGGGGLPAGGLDRQIQFNSGGELTGDSAMFFSSTGNVIFVSNGGNFGIGTAAAGRPITMSVDYTDTGGSIGKYYSYNLNPPGNIGGQSTADMTEVFVGGNNNNVGNVMADMNFVYAEGTGTKGWMPGQYTSVQNSGTGNVGSIQGFYTELFNSNAAVNEMVGSDTWIRSNSGSVTDMIGTRILLENTAATLTNRYGIYIDPPTGAVTTDDYGIYQEGIQPNYFGGSVQSDGIMQMAYRGESCDASNEGAIHFDSTDDSFYVCGDGASWQRIIVAGGGAGGLPAAGSQNQIQYNSGNELAADANFVYTSTGQLGLGTSNPVGTLDVVTASPFTSFSLTAANTGLSAFAIYTDRPFLDEGLGTSLNPSGGNMGWVHGANGAATGGFQGWGLQYYDGANDGVTMMAVNNAGQVGVGKFTQTTRLDVNGTVRMAYDGESCDANREGAIHFDSAQDKFFVCANGTSWEPMTTGASAITFVSLTDTPATFTSAAGRFVRVNSGETALEFTDQLFETITGEPDPIGLLLDDLDDTDVAGVGAGQCLKYNNGTGNWEPGDCLAPGDGSLWQVGTGDIIYYDSGTPLVGIGTNTPSTTLEVQEANATIFVNGSGNVGLQAQSTDSSARNFGFVTDGDALYIKNNTDSAGIFNIRNSANEDIVQVSFDAPADSLFLSSAGMLGIGTTAPLAPLHVLSGVEPHLFLDSTTQDAAIHLRETGGGLGAIHYEGDDNGMSFRVNGTGQAERRMFITDAGDVAIGPNFIAPDTRLDVNGTLKLAYGGEACDANREGAIHYDSSSDTFYFCATAGGWESVSLGSGVTEIDDLSDASTNYTSNSMYLGQSAGTSSTGSANVFLGSEAGMNNLGADYNTFVGARAGRANTTGANNTFVGDYAGYNNQTGYGNAYFGVNAGEDSVGANNNVAIGGAALQYFAATGQSYNTAVGTYALQGVDGSSTGTQNVALGGLAGDSITTGSSNIFIGYDVDAPSATTSNYMNIGDVLFGSSLYGGADPRIGTYKYCDETLTNCFTAADIASGSSAAPGSDREIIFNSGDVFFASGNFMFDADGDLVVGATAKSAWLNNGSSGDAQFSGSVAAQQFNVQQSAGGGVTWTTGDLEIVGNATSQSMYFLTDNAVRMGMDDGAVWFGSNSFGGSASEPEIVIGESVGDRPSLMFYDPGSDLTEIGITSDDYFAIATEDTQSGIQFRVGADWTTNMIDTAVPAMTITTYESVGIKTTGPNTALDVNGTLKMAYGGEACDASREGSIHYDSSSDTFYFCATAGGWESVSLGSGVTEIDDLSDARTDYTSASMFLGSGTGPTVVGTNNTALGFNAMASVTATGSDVAIGSYAMSTTTGTAGGNTVIGDSASPGVTGGNNTFIGQGAAYNGTGAGANNTGIGGSSLYNVTGGGNVALGMNSGAGITSGSNNIVIGYNINPAVVTGDNQMNIGGILFGSNLYNGASSKVGTYNYCDENFANCFTASDIATIGGSISFSSLSDTPATYSAQAGKFVRVNSGESGLEFTDELFESVAAPAPTAIALNDLDNVNSAPADGQCLVYNNGAGEWEAGNCDAGIGGVWQVGSGDDIYYNSGAPRVGIGTANPSTVLYVSAATANGTPLMTLDNPGNSGDYIHMINDLGNVVLSVNQENAGAGHLAINEANGTRIFEFSAQDSDFIITATNSQGASIVLDENSAGTVDAKIEYKVDGTSHAEIAYDEDAGNLYFVNDADNDGTGDTIFYSSASETLRITNAGLVGVGTNAPQTRFDVNGTLKVGYGGESCDASREGALYYDSAADKFYGCQTAGSWTELGSGAGGDTLYFTSSLTDTPASYTGHAGKVVKVNSGETGLEFTDQLFENVAGNAPNAIVLNDLGDVTAAPSGGQFLMYNSVSGQWIASDVTGGVSNAAGSDRQIQFNNGGTAMGADANFVYTSAGDLIVGSYQLDDTTTGTEDNRMFFDVSKGAFRAGSTQSVRWDDANVGDNSIALGLDTTAAGSESVAIGENIESFGTSGMSLGSDLINSADFGLALGHNVNIGNGVAGSGQGDYSAGIGLGEMSTTNPQITGNYSFGIFLGDQDALTFSANNTMGLFGGKLVIDPAIPAVDLVADVALDVNGTIKIGYQGEACDASREGAIYYDSAADKFYGCQTAGSWTELGSGAGGISFSSLTDTPASYSAQAGKFVRVTSGENGVEFTDEIIEIVSGEPAPNTIDLGDLGDVNASPTDGQCLKYNNATGDWEAGDCATTGSGGKWSDGAGGEIYYDSANVGIGLTDPTEALDVVGSVKLSSSLIMGIHTGIGTPLSSLVDNDTLASLSCSSGQVPEWNGSAWVCTSETLAALSCSNGEVAEWNGSAWVCGAGGGGGGSAIWSDSGSGYIEYSNALGGIKLGTTSGGDTPVSNFVDALNDLSDVNLGAGIGDAECLKYSSSTGEWAAGTCGSGGGGASGKWGGVAGGEIYYNSANVGIGLTDPTVALDVVGQIKLSSSLLLGTVSGAAAPLSSITDNDTLAALSCSNDQVASWNGSAWVCADQTGGGGSGGGIGLWNDTGSGYIEYSAARGGMKVAGMSGLNEPAYSSAGSGADNLGNHTATQDLDMSNNDINNILSLNLDVITSIGTPVYSSSSGSDTLSGLSCSNGQVAAWNGSAWACADGGGGSGTSGKWGGVAGGEIYYNSANVGIGLTDPTEALDVVGNIKLSSSIIFGLTTGLDAPVYMSAGSSSGGGGGGGGGGDSLWSDSGSGYIEYSSALGGMKIGSVTGASAPVGAIGSGSGGGGATPGGLDTQIQFNDGGSALGGSANLTWDGSTLSVAGDIEYTGAITDVSDMRLKTDIVPLQTEEVIGKLSQINTYSFRMKDDPKGALEFGVMAQELEKVFPELVKTADDEMGTKSVNYVGLIAPLIEASKELKNENDTLKAELADMKAAQADILREVKGLKAHTGYGVSKAEIGLLIIGAMGGTAILFFLGTAMIRRRRGGAE